MVITIIQTRFLYASLRKSGCLKYKYNKRVRSSYIQIGPLEVVVWFA